VTGGGSGSLLAISDLHVDVSENRAVLDELRPGSDGDWLIVAGDVGETMAEIESALAELAARFARVVWVPGNHELWTRPDDPCGLRGEGRYRRIVEHCRRLGIDTPEDPFPVWEGTGGPLVVAPLFLLYDYSFGRDLGPTKHESLARAREAGVVCSDEIVLFPDPYPSIEEWCRERVDYSRARLEEATRDGARTVLVNHWPLVRELTRPLFFPEFAQWCGTEATADWHRRFGARAVVFGHLHIPRTTVHDGVPFVEVSVGYPREWRRRSPHPPGVRHVLAD
jgi:3',5'-cyclic AMP phosphodiesterase CpdA